MQSKANFMLKFVWKQICLTKIYMLTFLNQNLPIIFPQKIKFSHRFFPGHHLVPIAPRLSSFLHPVSFRSSWGWGKNAAAWQGTVRTKMTGDENDGGKWWEDPVSKSQIFSEGFIDITTRSVGRDHSSIVCPNQAPYSVRGSNCNLQERRAKKGYTLIGEWHKGEIYTGKLYDESGKYVSEIIIGRQWL